MSIKQFDEGTTLNEVASRFIPGTPQDLRVSSSHSLMFMFNGEGDVTEERTFTSKRYEDIDKYRKALAGQETHLWQ